MDKGWMMVSEGKEQLSNLIASNWISERFGLTLSKQDAELILEERKNVLREQRRVEFGEGIIPKIIYEFYDSDYIDQDNYRDTLIRLQEIFYLYKNETRDRLTDEELLHLMKEQFEYQCFGDLDELADTYLMQAAGAIRAGVPYDRLIQRSDI